MTRMSLQYILQQDIAHKYLRDELIPEEKIAFEIFILDKPDLIEELELDHLFFQHLEKVPVPQQPEKHVLPGPGLLAWLGDWRSPALASAFTFMFCAVVASLLWPQQHKAPVASHGGAAAQIFYLDALRSSNANEPRQLTVQADITNAVLVLSPIHRGLSPYQVVVSQDGSEVSRVQQLHTDSMGELTISLPVPAQSGNYQLSIIAHDQQTESIDLHLTIANRTNKG